MARPVCTTPRVVRRALSTIASQHLSTAEAHCTRRRWPAALLPWKRRASKGKTSAPTKTSNCATGRAVRTTATDRDTDLYTTSSSSSAEEEEGGGGDERRAGGLLLHLATKLPLRSTKHIGLTLLAKSFSLDVGPTCVVLGVL